jgi:hypothetical protein
MLFKNVPSVSGRCKLGHPYGVNSPKLSGSNVAINLEFPNSFEFRSCVDGKTRPRSMIGSRTLRVASTATMFLTRESQIANFLQLVNSTPQPILFNQSMRSYISRTC